MLKGWEIIEYTKLLSPTGWEVYFSRQKKKNTTVLHRVMSMLIWKAQKIMLFNEKN